MRRWWSRAIRGARFGRRENSSRPDLVSSLLNNELHLRPILTDGESSLRHEQQQHGVTHSSSRRFGWHQTATDTIEDESIHDRPLLR